LKSKGENFDLQPPVDLPATLPDEKNLGKREKKNSLTLLTVRAAAFTKGEKESGANRS